ncbi:hypothetical protein [Streptomyces sp. AS13]|uniref:hypothetical protein n=1 Tax=Streptomyces sp. AS13 TaxID=3038080 RepID=UPI00278C8ADC|nr:hypothetical protein [Streptomyces sp. AS13]
MTARRNRSPVLQCTTVTPLPTGEALAALLAMPGGPDDAADHLADMAFVLCELGEHTDETEHAAHLWTAEAQPPPGLWFLWTGNDGGLRVHHRFATLTMCPARLHDLREDSRRWCGLFEDHPGRHSFDVSDPLRELLHERIRREARRRAVAEDSGPDDEDRDTS